MPRIWTLAPAIVVLLGAIIVAFGGLWAAVRQSKSSAELRASNSELRQKNDTILELQKEIINITKGADLCFVIVANQHDANGRFALSIVAPNELPVFDVYLRVISNVDAPMDTPEQQSKALYNISNPTIMNIGNMPARGVKNVDLALEAGHYQIDIRTRNAKYTEMLKFSPFADGLGQSMIVSDYKGNVLKKFTSPDGFPSIY